MNTKLTLRIDRDLIQRAKEHAAANGQSVSQLVSDYFALLDRERPDEPMTPIVSRLRGMLAGVDERDYHRYLEDKYL